MIILYVKDSKVTIRKFLQLLNTFSMVVGSKMSTQKSAVFLNIEKKIRAVILLIMPLILSWNKSI